MGKFDLDRILSDLGVGDDELGGPAEPRPVDHTHPLTPPRVTPSRGPAYDAASPPAARTPPNAKQPPPGAPDRRGGGGGSDSPPPAAAHHGMTGFRSVFEPDDAAADPGLTDLAALLAARGVITTKQLAAAQQILKQAPGKRLGDVLIEQGADEEAVQEALAEAARLPFERVDFDKGLDGGFDGRLLQRLSMPFCKEHMVLPLRIEGARVVMGITRPDDVFLVDEVRRLLGAASIKLVIVTPGDIRTALDIVGAPAADEQPDLTDILADVDESDVELERASSGDAVDLEQQAGESPVIRYVNYIIQTAIQDGASDIHIEPGEKKLKVRFRIDGVLFEMLNPPASMSAAITSRIKIMANLDISERRMPQDGRIRCTVAGRKLDLRVSTLPSGGGEKTVMRILDTRSINVELQELGFSEEVYHVWRRQIDEPHGIILVTGPTGSGKTTTLYASLRQLDKTSMNVSTVEDPVEYHLDGITQTQTHEKIGMTFARALKALLRQDPDVIMLGEIRDQETAVTAIQAALTGHLVLSTLHTNDAPSSITRLVNIGIEPFLVGAAVNSVLAQRLVRKLCAHCKAHDPLSEEYAEFLRMRGIDPAGVFTAKGCDRCRSTGYSGRSGIYELLTVNDQVRDMIARSPNVAEFRRYCIERGMVTLRDDGMRKVADGVTTIEEILRVTEAAVS